MDLVENKQPEEESAHVSEPGMRRLLHRHPSRKDREYLGDRARKP